MSTDKNTNPDINEIDIDEWCESLACTEEQLRYCIERVGTSWISVEAFWSMNTARLRKTFPKNKDITSLN